MSKTLSTVIAEAFDSEVKNAYQSSGKLKNTVTFRDATGNGIYKFRRRGKAIATPRVSQTDAQLADISNSLIPATIEEWEANELTDIFDNAQVNFEEMRDLAEALMDATGRRNDQLIIDAMNTLHADSGSYADTVAKTVGGNNAFNIGKLRAMASALDDKGVPEQDRTLLYTAAAKDQLLGTTEVTSGDYNTIRALVNGTINTFMGFNFVLIETRDEGGLPLSTNDVTAFAYHKRAVGLATALTRSAVDWIPLKKGWLCANDLAAGAVTIEAEGVVTATFDKTVSI